MQNLKKTVMENLSLSVASVRGNNNIPLILILVSLLSSIHIINKKNLEQYKLAKFTNQNRNNQLINSINSLNTQKYKQTQIRNVKIY